MARIEEEMSPAGSFHVAGAISGGDDDRVATVGADGWTPPVSEPVCGHGLVLGRYGDDVGPRVGLLGRGWPSPLSFFLFLFFF